jgi:hypothetical protein
MGQFSMEKPALKGQFSVEINSIGGRERRETDIGAVDLELDAGDAAAFGGGGGGGEYDC